MKEARAGLADFKHYKAMMSNLALHGVIEFVPETQDHRFRLAPSFQEAIMATFGQALTDSKWKANPAPFRDLLIESTAVNLRAAYAETLLKKEEFAELLLLIFSAVSERMSEAIQHLKPEGYKTLLEDLKAESFSRPAKFHITLNEKTTDVIRDKMTTTKSRIYS